MRGRPGPRPGDRSGRRRGAPPAVVRRGSPPAPESRRAGAVRRRRSRSRGRRRRWHEGLPDAIRAERGGAIANRHRRRPRATRRPRHHALVAATMDGSPRPGDSRSQDLDRHPASLTVWSPDDLDGILPWSMNAATTDNPQPTEISLPIEGMTCASCVNRIERFLEQDARRRRRDGQPRDRDGDDPLPPRRRGPGRARPGHRSRRVRRPAPAAGVLGRRRARRALALADGFAADDRAARARVARPAHRGGRLDRDGARDHGRDVRAADASSASSS